jgi:L,D-peptidoglycan transpeptidase YkuD (ErfK/YbiS/YcfS/YnhG family)
MAATREIDKISKEFQRMRATVTRTGDLTIGNETFRTALGHGGVRSDKREGDGATPVGLLPLRSVLYRPDRQSLPVCAVPVQPVTPSDGWCDDPTHPAYNRPIRLPINASAEVLWRDDGCYDIIGILGWNDDPVEPSRGSAIFLHIARPDFTPTEGCVALSLENLLHVLAIGLTEIVVAA